MEYAPLKIAITKATATKRRMFDSGELVSAFKGKRHTSEAKQKNREKHLGHVAWSRGLTKETHPSLAHQSMVRKTKYAGKNAPMYGRKFSDEHKQRIAAKTEKRWKDPKWQQEAHRLLNARPNGQEQTLIEIFEREKLPFAYVGDFKFFIEGKCPDFVNTNGKKQVIEYNGFFTHNEEEEIIRNEIFSRYGFKTLFLHGSDLKHPETIPQKVRDFMGGAMKE